jgi:hypothetical protein
MPDDAPVLVDDEPKVEEPDLVEWAEERLAIAEDALVDAALYVDDTRRLLVEARRAQTELPEGRVLSPDLFLQAESSTVKATRRGLVRRVVGEEIA